MRYVMVTLAVHREGEHYVADCLELGTSSFGASEQQALDNVREATLLYLGTLDEMDECERVLHDRGVVIVDGGTACTRRPPSLLPTTG
jgi:predicted RNase H-like HicB family nuclease